MKLWLNVAEGAEYSGVRRDLIYDACAARRIRHIRVGGRRAIRLKRERIDAWLERHAVLAQDGRLRCARRLAPASERKAGHERDRYHPSVAHAHDNGRAPEPRDDSAVLPPESGGL